MKTARDHAGMRWWSVGLCALAGLAVFQFFGNATRGYIDTASLFHWWISQWSNPGSETEHGWLVLGLATWVAWRNWCEGESVGAQDGGGAGVGRSALENASSVVPGAVAMLAGLGLHVLGFVAQQTRVSIVALLLFIWGVVRLGGGRRAGAALLFPLGLMLFAIPINVLDSVGFWLRVWVVDASAAIARGAGIGVLQSGTQLLAPDGRYHYDVAEACSGVRSLTAMAALSLLAGYLNFKDAKRRGLVFLLCFPFVYVGNVARILAIIFAAHRGGPKWGDIAHDVMGWGIFVIVLGGVLLAIAALRRWWPEGEKSEVRSAKSEINGAKTGTGAVAAVGVSWWASAVVVAVALVTMGYLYRVAHRPPHGGVGVLLAREGRDPVELPAFIGTDWAGRRAEVSAVERAVLPPDTGYSRKLYVSLGRQAVPEVFLSLVLSGRDRSSIHRPELCLVGQGWTITGQLEHRFADARGGAFPATVLRVQREVAGRSGGKTVVPQLTAYWFVNADRVVATHWERLAWDAWNRVRGGRVDRWAYILMQTDATDGEPAALARMQAILNGTLAHFQQVGANDGSAVVLRK